MTFSKETSLKKSKKFNKTRISSLTVSSEEDFSSEFYYPDKIVTDTEGNVEVLSISRDLPIRSHIVNN